MTTTRRLNDSNKVIVTAALTGAVTTKQDNPYLPTQPKEIAEAALRCYEAGAAMVHIHVRDDNDAGSMRFDKFEEAVGLIRATGCPVLLNLTSSGGQGFSWEERIRPFRELRPEMASFDAGTMNWLHSVVFMNEPKFLELCGQEMRAAGVKPEIEVFDMGMLNTAKHYLKTGVLDAPAHFQLCLGAPAAWRPPRRAWSTWSTICPRTAPGVPLESAGVQMRLPWPPWRWAVISGSVWRTMSITIRGYWPRAASSLSAG